MAYQVPAHLAKFATQFNSAEQFKVTSAQSFPHISLGGERFTAIDAEGEKTVLGLDGFEFIAVASNPATSKIYFSGPYTGDEGTPPDCYSDNGYYPDVRSSKPQCESCALCEWARWGSAKSNLTQKDVKACSDFKKLAILPVHDTVEGVHMFRISPAATKNWSRYLNDLRKIGAEVGIDLTPDLVFTKVFWSDKKNIMDFEFVDFLDEDTCGVVSEIKEENTFESWIGLDSQAQTYPVLASEPRGVQQRLAAPKRQEPEPVEAEVIGEKPAVKRTLRSRTAALEAAQEPVPGRAAAEARALGACQGERRQTPAEVAAARVGAGKRNFADEARARARQQMGR
jgi:hypothetical protein